ncbi:Endothelin-converting enzyme-like 1 [Gryllus bimaculatus]|nr:Endothelin-converting enzyme-like 1 [Gryllus bimaculatus]
MDERSNAGPRAAEWTKGQRNEHSAEEAVGGARHTDGGASGLRTRKRCTKEEATLEQIWRVVGPVPEGGRIAWLAVEDEWRQCAEETRCGALACVRASERQDDEGCSRAGANADAFTCREEQCWEAARRMQASMDWRADPCRDFYAYACGGWARDASAWPPAAAAAAAAASLATLQRLVDLQLQMLALLDELGGYLPPGAPPPDLTALVARLLQVNGAPLFDVDLDADPRNRSRLAIFLDLPRRSAAAAPLWQRPTKRRYIEIIIIFQIACLNKELLNNFGKKLIIVLKYRKNNSNVLYNMMLCVENTIHTCQPTEAFCLKHFLSIQNPAS